MVVGLNISNRPDLYGEQDVKALDQAISECMQSFRSSFYVLDFFV